MTPSLLDHLDTLFAYDLWANRALAAALGEASPGGVASESPEVREAARLFAHLTRASEVWLGRVEGTGAAGLPVWPSDGDVAASLARAERAAAGWRAHLRAVGDRGLGQAIAYRNTRGERFETERAGIIAHVVNHGTHHRGQAVHLLREAGLEPPVLDVIAYLRGPGRQAGGDQPGPAQAGQ